MTHLEQQMDVSEDGPKKEFFVCLLLSKTSPISSVLKLLFFINDVLYVALLSDEVKEF